MIPAIEQRAEELKHLCQIYSVQRLDLFGSAASGEHCAEASDLDFLVEFKPTAYNAYADTYFGLLESLEDLFEKRVDLVVVSAIKNPYFLQSVNQTRELVYEA